MVRKAECMQTHHKHSHVSKALLPDFTPRTFATVHPPASLDSPWQSSTVSSKTFPTTVGVTTSSSEKLSILAIKLKFSLFGRHVAISNEVSSSWRPKGEKKKKLPDSGLFALSLSLLVATICSLSPTIKLIEPVCESRVRGATGISHTVLLIFHARACAWSVERRRARENKRLTHSHARTRTSLAPGSIRSLTFFCVPAPQPLFYSLTCVFCFTFFLPKHTALNKFLTLRDAIISSRVRLISLPVALTNLRWSLL